MAAGPAAPAWAELHWGTLAVQLPARAWEVHGAQGSQGPLAAFWSFPSALGQRRAPGLSDEEFGTTSALKEGEGLWGGRADSCSSESTVRAQQQQ